MIFTANNAVTITTEVHFYFLLFLWHERSLCAEEAQKKNIGFYFGRLMVPSRGKKNKQKKLNTWTWIQEFVHLFLPLLQLTPNI